MELLAFVLLYGIYALGWLLSLPLLYGTVWVIARAAQNGWR